jgi:hypothetical protein
MFINYVKDSWVPETLAKLAAERKRLHKRNVALGLPAAHGRSCPPGQAVGAGLRQLREAAKASVAAAIEKEKSWLMDKFSQQMVQLEKDLEVALRGVAPAPTPAQAQAQARAARAPRAARAAPTKPVALTVDITDTKKLEEVLAAKQAELMAVCNAANDNTQFTGWLQTALNREDSSFQLARFPQIVAAFVSKANELLRPCQVAFRTAAQTCIQQQLDPNGPAVSITHNWAPTSMTTTVTLDPQRIIGAITQAYAPARVEVLDTLLSEHATALVEATIKIDTEDACNGERLELLQQIDFVDEAAKGICTIGCQHVSLSHL